MLETGNQALNDYIMQRFQGFIQDNQKEKKGGIVFVGDSITEFFPLKKYLGRDHHLINRGIAGTDTVWLQEHLAEQVLAVEPSKVFLSIGTNDIGRGYDKQDTIERFIDIINQLKSENPFVQIYILSIFPVNESADYKEKVKVRNNQAIQSLNQDLSLLPGAEFIDLYPLLLDQKGQLAANLTTDGLHLTMPAYEIISKKLALYL
ncbi:SGNH/GDSL hydrolase family protein [Streptococcus sp. sy004]|uniref:SGNH/GDSL hydrolase family protein n=1 Tax=Streptococcus sp. sy004 TaxID=2600149 RepID=UPI0011B35F81|nr:SGNH/GDSL hydrolase family protein [Streptococcus sp. sy004]TWT12373.1 lipase [Streptococcus sp. sy004]